MTSATIAFGSNTDNSTKQLSWPAFSAKYLTAGSASTLSAMPQLGQVTGTPTTSAGTTPTGDADKPWKLVAEWSLSVTSTAAATQLQLPATLLSYGLSEVPGIASMAIDSLTLTLAVTVTGSAGGDASPPILGPGDPGEGLRVTLVTAPLPKGVWTANPNAGTIPSGDTITAGTGFVLQASATVEGATPEIPASQIEPSRVRRPLPFAQETDGTARAAARRQQRRSVRHRAAAVGRRGARRRARVPDQRPAGLAADAHGRAGVRPGPGRAAQAGAADRGNGLPADPGTGHDACHPARRRRSSTPACTRRCWPAILSGGPAPAQRPVLRTSVIATAAAAADAIRAAAPAQPAAPPAAAAIPRVPAPTLASVAAQSDPALAAVLARQAPAAQVAASGLRAADGGPGQPESGHARRAARRAGHHRRPAHAAGRQPPGPARERPDASGPATWS